MYPKRPASHVVEEESLRIFRAACPSEWIVSPMFPDYGLDLRVEVVRASQVTGMEFFVQLKGTRKPKMPCSSSAKVAVPASTVNYWLAKLHPVLVVLVDVDRGSFWFGWLEHAYEQYPCIAENGKSTSLFLANDSASVHFECCILDYIEAYFGRLRSDLGRIAGHTQLTRSLLHVSALHRLCASMTITLQNGDIETADQLRDLCWSFYLEFGIHDDFLTGQWNAYEEHSQSASQDVAGMIGERLKAYRELRNQFFNRERQVEAGDLWLVPVSYTGVTKYLLPTMSVLAELQDILLQAIVLGKIVYES